MLNYIFGIIKVLRGQDQILSCILPTGGKTLALYRIPKTVSSMATRKAPRMCKLELVFWLNWKAHR